MCAILVAYDLGFLLIIITTLILCLLHEAARYQFRTFGEAPMYVYLRGSSEY